MRRALLAAALCDDGGTCVLTPRSCFEPRITRSGEPSPLGRYCAFQDKDCVINTDCTASGDYCVSSASRPETVGLLCAPATTSPALDSAIGLTGPAALRLRGLFKMCYCGDETIDCTEQCDDGNALPGDGCDSYCREEP
jgi:cysteine-rich repeat protein